MFYFAAFKIVESYYVHSGKVAMKFNGNWEILHVKHWNEELGRLLCKTIGYPGLVKKLQTTEYHNKPNYDNFQCQNIRNRLVCCPQNPKARHSLASIPEVALACEQGEINKTIIL